MPLARCFFAFTLKDSLHFVLEPHLSDGTPGTTTSGRERVVAWLQRCRVGCFSSESKADGGKELHRHEIKIGAEQSSPSHFEPVEHSCLEISLYTTLYQANSRPIVDAMLLVVID